MATPVVITSLKHFTYRGAREDWSNSYHIDGANPADATAWGALYDKIRDLEKACLPTSVSLDGYYGYNIDADHATYSDPARTPVAGTLTSTGGQWCPGDAAVWVRWSTGTFGSSGKPIYLRKYFHGAVGTTADLDVILPAQKTALTALGAAMYSGSGLTGTRKIVGPTGTAVTAHLACSYVTTRTLKRRGKRPTS